MRTSLGRRSARHRGEKVNPSSVDELLVQTRCLAVQTDDDAAPRIQRQLLQEISDMCTLGHIQCQDASVGRQSDELGMQVDLDLHWASVRTPSGVGAGVPMDEEGWPTGALNT
jgi:hypothetical protein